MKKLSTKLLIFIILIFAFQASVFFLFQNFFLDSFYVERKSKEVYDALENTIEAYKETEDSLEQAKILRQFMDEMNEPIIVLSNDGYHDSTYYASFEQTIEFVIDNESYIFIVDEFEGYDLDYYDLINKEITVTGFQDDIFYPLQIAFDDLVLNNQDLFFMEGEEVTKSATIVDYDMFIFSNDILVRQDAVVDYYYSGIEDDQFNYIQMEDRVNGERLVFLSMIALQPINEVIAIQSSFQLYLMLFVFILIIVLGFIVSKMISKPLIRVMHNASEISNFNFDVVCDETRSDEIGLLGKEINKLSFSLKEKINDLEITNLKLEDEIEFERKQESIRRLFVADVSHELKTPLGVIKSYSEGIQDGISKEKADYYLSVIIEEVSKMNELIMNMLELSHMKSQMKQVTYETVSIKRMMKNILRAFEPIIENNNIDLNLDLDDGMHQVDIHLMELILNNLISNSIRYISPPNTLIISLNKGEFIISNSSVPISDEAMSKLFDRFYRVENSRSKALGGNGLGLSLVKEALELQNIAYSIKSSDNFEFKILFPEV